MCNFLWLCVFFCVLIAWCQWSMICMWMRCELKSMIDRFDLIYCWNLCTYAQFLFLWFILPLWRYKHDLFHNDSLCTASHKIDILLQYWISLILIEKKKRKITWQLKSMIWTCCFFLLVAMKNINQFCSYLKIINNRFSFRISMPLFVCSVKFDK